MQVKYPVLSREAYQSPFRKIPCLQGKMLQTPSAPSPAKKEDLQASAERELKEQLGVSKDKIKLSKILSETYSYDWPKQYRVLRPYKGQRQQFALWQFTGTKQDFDFSRSDEVSNIKWVNKNNLLNTIAPVRRKAVEHIYKHL